MHTHLYRRGRAGLPLALLALVFGGLGSGCQSARGSYSFQPIASTTVAAATVAAPQPQPQPQPQNIATAAAPEALAAAVAPRPRGTRPVLAPTRPGRQLAAAAPHYLAATTRQHPWRLRHRPQGTAEVGLGTTVLGVLGLVALPIALIGLLLSGGGLVWGIVAGAAALAVLVAYLDPFG